MRTGLAATPKTLPPKYFYDARGSELFEQITELPEYYPTRAEQSILDEVARRDRRAGASRRSWSSSGPGSARKTHALLDPMVGSGRPPLRPGRRVGVGRRGVGDAAGRATYDGLEIHGVVGDFERHLDRIPPAATAG